MDIPAPPWRLTGFAVVVPEFGLRARLLVNYQTSPVGPYLENAVVRMTIRGLTVTEMGVTSEATRVAGRTLWGFPKTLMTLGFMASSEGLDFWEDVPGRGRRTWDVVSKGPTLPIRKRFHTVQRREGEEIWLRVPGLVTGRVRLGMNNLRPVVVITEFQLVMEAGQPMVKR